MNIALETCESMLKDANHVLTVHFDGLNAEDVYALGASLMELIEKPEKLKECEFDQLQGVVNFALAGFLNVAYKRLRTIKSEQN